MWDDERDVERIREQVKARLSRRDSFRTVINVMIVLGVLSAVGTFAIMARTGAFSSWGFSPWVSLIILIVIARVLRRNGRLFSRRLEPGDDEIERAVRRAMQRQPRRMARRGGEIEYARRYRDVGSDDDDYAYDDAHEKPKRHPENPPEKRKNDAPVHLGDDGELVFDDELAPEDESAEPPRRAG